MKHTLFKSLAMAAVAGFLAMAPNADAVLLTFIGNFDGNDSENGQGNTTSINDLFDDDCDPLALIYRSNSGRTGQEAGETAWFDVDFDPNFDPQTAELTFEDITLGEFNSLDWTYAVVKGGNGFALYSISSWLFGESIDFDNDNIGNKGISHVTLYACEGGSTSVPEGGTSVALLGLALAGLGASRRFLSKKA